jgi:hypothetical protein
MDAKIEVASEQETLVPLKRYSRPLPENPDHHFQRRTVHAWGAFEETAFTPWSELLNPKPHICYTSSLLCEIDATNGFLLMSNSIRDDVILPDSSMINPRFTAGRWFGVWNCQTARRQLKTTIFTSTVYGRVWRWQWPLHLHLRLNPCVICV